MINARIREVIEHLFPPEQQQEASDLLEVECGRSLLYEKSNEQDLERVRLGVLKLSKGDMGKLYYWVEQAQIDFRDVLMAADFGVSITAHNEWVKQFTSTE